MKQQGGRAIPFTRPSTSQALSIAARSREIASNPATVAMMVRFTCVDLLLPTLSPMVLLRAGAALSSRWPPCIQHLGAGQRGCRPSSRRRRRRLWGWRRSPACTLARQSCACTYQPTAIPATATSADLTAFRRCRGRPLKRDSRATDQRQARRRFRQCRLLADSGRHPSSYRQWVHPLPIGKFPQ